jgi:hypothetical protein
MADGAHDMSSVTLLIDCVAHGLAVDCKTLVLFSISFIPASQGSVQMRGIDTDEHISDDGFTWDHAPAFLHAAPETLACLLAKAVCPVCHGLIAPHPAQDRASGYGKHGCKSMTASLNPAGIGDIGEKLGQRSHMIGGYNHFGSSNIKGRFESGAREQISRIGQQGSYEKHFG